MTEISYPDLQNVKENIPEVPANVLKNKSATNPQTKKIGNSTDPAKSWNYSNVGQINPVFKLGDETHRIVLDLAIKCPELLKKADCGGLKMVSEFLVRRKNKRPYCHKLEKCNVSGCSKAHKVSAADSREFCENVPTMIAFLFLRPAVRRKLVLPSFARDVFERFSNSMYPQVDLLWIIKTIRSWSFAPMHESGMGFNPWIFIKSDYSQYQSATNYFLQIFSNILKVDVKLKCNKVRCATLDCTRLHFNVTQLDRSGAFRWVLRLVLTEVNDRYKFYDDTEALVLSTTTRLMKDPSSSSSMISQYSSLLILADMGLNYHDQILLALRKFFDFSDYSSTTNEIEDEPETITLSELDTGRLIESCFSVLQTSKSHKLLTVSQYGCSIGDAYMKILLDTFRKHLVKSFNKKLPMGITRKQVAAILTEEVPYTMAMHLWLFKTASCLEIAEELQEMKIKGFKDVEKGVVTVVNWKDAAIRACNDKNHKWLALMKTPLQKDIVSACDTFMPGWIRALSGLIRKSAPNVILSTNNEETASRRRWEDEDIPANSCEDDDMTDWRKIIRLLRNYYLSYPFNSRKTQQLLGSVLNYLLMASHKLKHNDYANFDGEFFLFLAYQLFELMEMLCRNQELQFLVGSYDENAQSGSRITGFVTFSSMSKEESVEMASQFESCKIKIAKFLPLDGTYLKKWIEDPEADKLDLIFAGLSIEGVTENVKSQTDS